MSSSGACRSFPGDCSLDPEYHGGAVGGGLKLRIPTQIVLWAWPVSRNILTGLRQSPVATRSAGVTGPNYRDCPKTPT